MSSVLVTTESQLGSQEESPARTRPGALAELLLVGGLTPVLLPLAWLLRRSLGLDDAELTVGFVMFYAANVINNPHFAVTYLLFYRDARARALGTAFPAAQRVRYLLAGVIAPLLLAGWACSALWLRSARSLSLLIQLMFLLVSWHYVKQGFGVLTVLAARRGVRFARAERLAILAHCYAGWAYAWASPFDAGHQSEEKGVFYQTFAHPTWLMPLTFALLLCTIPPLAYVVVQSARRAGLALFTPLFAFLCSIWAWSIYSSFDPLVRYVIPALHSLQYLYIVWLLKSSEAREREAAPYFGPSLGARLGVLLLSAVGLGWLLFHGLPELLDETLVTRTMARSALGPTPYFAALYAFVNIHHYLMDAVLWRRENPEMRHLTATG